MVWMMELQLRQERLLACAGGFPAGRGCAQRLDSGCFLWDLEFIPRDFGKVPAPSAIGYLGLTKWAHDVGLGTGAM